MSSAVAELPLVSVLMPAYNHSRYVAEAVRSVIAQDYPRIELIAIDDGSKDATWSILQSLRGEAQAHLERVEISTQPNSGTCHTANRLIERARGDFVMLMASDDALSPGAITALLQPMTNDLSVGVTLGQNEFMDGDSRTCYRSQSGECVYEELPGCYRSLNESICQPLGIDQFSTNFGTYAELTKANHIANGCLIRKRILDQIGKFTPDSPLEDYWQHLQLAKLTRYRSISTVTFRYRWHAANTSRSRLRMVAMTAMTIGYEYRNCRASLHGRDAKALDAAYVRWCRRTAVVVHVFYPELWPELAAAIRNISEPRDLFITYVDEHSIAVAREDFPDATFIACENRGFDVWPFLKVLAMLDPATHPYVVKLHTKRDIDIGRKVHFHGADWNGSVWRRRLLAFCESRASWREALRRLARSEVGMVAEQYTVVGRDDVPFADARPCFDEAVHEVRRRYGEGVADLDSAKFVAGTMFVAKTAALSRLCGDDWRAEAFEESAPKSGDAYGRAHVVERMLGLVIAAEKLRIATVHSQFPGCRASGEGLPTRIAVIAHVFYPDFWPELADCIRNITEVKDVYITYVDEKAVTRARLDFPSATFVKCENRGFDIWPFLSLAATLDLTRYAAVVKLHTKRDIVLDREWVFNHCRFNGSAWRDHLLAFCRTPDAWRRTLARLNEHGVGMVADRHVIVRRRDFPWQEVRGCFDAAVDEIRAIDGCLEFDASIAQYVSGTMFVVRPQVLQFLLKRGFVGEMFDVSSHSRDGTILYAHRVENLFGLAVSAVGLEIRAFNGSLAWRRFYAPLLRMLFRAKETRERILVKVLGIPVCWRRKLFSPRPPRTV